MKKLRIYITSFDEKNNLGKYIENYQSKLIYKDERDVWYLGDERINMSYSILSFNENLSKLLIRIINLANKKAASITRENVGDLIYPNSIETLAYSLVQKYWYETEQKDVLDFVTEFMIKILNGHLFENGNKRTALIATKALLYELGYYLKWSSVSTEVYINEYVEKLEKITKLDESNGNPLKAHKIAKELLKSSIIFAANKRR